MSDKQTLSLSMAILINLNVMLGAGIFINTTSLAHYAGGLGFVAYLIIGLLMLPLIVSIARLLHYYPHDGFYGFAVSQLGTRAGFLSAWSYFTGKLASSMLMIHVAVTLLQSVIPSFALVNTYVVDLGILTLFILFNMMNLRLGSIIQALFMSFKSIPILGGITLGALLTQREHFAHEQLHWDGIPTSLSLVLYATVGFEAACSLSSRIRNAEKNAPRVVLVSFAIVVLIACLYQLFFYGAVGPALGNLPNYRYAFPTLLEHCPFLSASLCSSAITLLHTAIACSALGGSYGIIFSNTWNLYTLAQHKHTFAPSLFTRPNKHQIPWLCVLAQGFFCAFYLALTRGAQLPLQQISALGCTLAYTMSVLSLGIIYRRNNGSIVDYGIVVGGLISCAILVSACISGLYMQSSFALITFILILCFGLGMFEITKKNQRTHATNP